VLPVLGRPEEARAIAEETVTAARAHGNPFYVATALMGHARSFAETDPARALDAMRQALVYSRDHCLVLGETIITREAAGLEAVHGEPGQALALFKTAIEALNRAADVSNMAIAFADLAVFFDRIDQPYISATIYGASHHGDLGLVTNLANGLDHLRTALGKTRFYECVAAGAAMEYSEAVQYARHQIQLAGRRLADSP
jgi:hypothetical protein